MTEPVNVAPQKDDFHFDALAAQATASIAECAQDLWSDYGPHDPGITLIEALAYGVSDLCYRNGRSLADLLTRAGASPAPIFPAGFSPGVALGSAPVTEDDYRRGILDLAAPAGSKTPARFLFRNAQLVPASPPKAYKYDSDHLGYALVDTQDDDAPIAKTGWFAVHAEPMPGVVEATARAILGDYLAQNRSLGIMFGDITITKPQEIDLRLSVDIDETEAPAETILADMYRAAVRFLTPPPVRAAATVLRDQQRPSEEVFAGPRLQYGQITQLPPAVNYANPEPIYLAGLNHLLRSISGVTGINSLGRGPDGFLASKDQWKLTVKGDSHPVLWWTQPDPIATLCDPAFVQLTSGGVAIARKIDVARVRGLIGQEAIEPQLAIPQPSGRWRNPGHYYPAQDKLPACYGLQSLAPSDDAGDLARFLLPFEQLAANEFARLAMLPDLLAFDRPATGTQWGAGWPFADGSFGAAQHGAYAALLKDLVQREAQDSDAELAIIDHLLGYFGQRRAPQLLNISTADFVRSQQDYLRHVADAGYGKAAAGDIGIPALQRRIAYRLGLDLPADLSQLPFYVIEHRALLPRIGPQAFDAEVAIERIAYIEEPDGGQSLLVTLPAAATAVPVPGQMLDVIDITDANTPQPWMHLCVVSDVTSDGPSFLMKPSMPLAIHDPSLSGKSMAGKFAVKNANLWLSCVPLAVAAASDQATLVNVDGTVIDKTRNPKRIRLDPFPWEIDIGTKIYIHGKRDFASTINGTQGGTWQAIATVVSWDAVAQNVVVTSNMGWDAIDLTNSVAIIEPEEADRFGPRLSLVFNSALKGQASDAAALDAWIATILEEELPCVVDARRLWMAPADFVHFGHSYAQWAKQESDSALSAYVLLSALQLGSHPQAPPPGIGTLKIATAADRATQTGGGKWDVSALETSKLLYVPKNAAADSVRIPTSTPTPTPTSDG